MPLTPHEVESMAKSLRAYLSLIEPPVINLDYGVDYYPRGERLLVQIHFLKPEYRYAFDECLNRHHLDIIDINSGVTSYSRVLNWKELPRVCIEDIASACADLKAMLQEAVEAEMPIIEVEAIPPNVLIATPAAATSTAPLANARRAEQTENIRAHDRNGCIVS